MRLLIIGDSPGVASGQARMVRELARRFAADGVQVTVAGWFDLDATRPFDPPGYRIIPAFKDRPEQLGLILQDCQPEIVLAIGDPWDFAWLAAQRATGASWLLCGFLNVEHDEIPSNCEVILDGFDAIRTTSEAGAASVDRPGVTAVHLGVDTSVFADSPRPTRILGHPTEEHFVVLVNAQNTTRKNLGASLAAIGSAAEKLPILAVFNSQPMSPAGQNLYEVLIRLDLEGKVKFNTRNQGPQSTVDDAEMAELYRAADVLLVTSISEGFGLPVLEAMASRTLVVAPQHSSLTELIAEGRGVPYSPGAAIIAQHGGGAHVIDPEDAAAALVRAYDLLEGDEGEAMLDRAQQFALTRSWDRTYGGIASMIAEAQPQPRWPAPGAHAGMGLPIDPMLRVRARQRSTPERMAVVKLGGLGDMLMATRVIRAANERWGLSAVVFANQFFDVFESMPEVVDIVKLQDSPQDLVVASIAEAFPLCLDLRVISRAYGIAAEPATPLSQAFSWMTDAWTQSLSRVSDLGRHVTALMLDSLGLPSNEIAPIYTPRGPVIVPPGAVVIAPGAGALGQLKKPDQVFWKTLVSGFGDRPVFQIGALDDLLVDGALDARGWRLPQTAALLEQADKVVAVESGLAHLARAVRGPVAAPAVVLFGPTPIAYAYPEHVNLSRGLCRPCFHQAPLWSIQQCGMSAPVCLNLPDVDDVLAAVKP